MGLFKIKGEVYKPVKDVDLGPNSREFYLRANVKAPRMAGFLVKIFVWLLEAPLLGAMLLYMLKRNNLIYKVIMKDMAERRPDFSFGITLLSHESKLHNCLSTYGPSLVTDHLSFLQIPCSWPPKMACEISGKFRSLLVYSGWKLVSFAELEEPPVFVPSQPVEGSKAPVSTAVVGTHDRLIISLYVKEQEVKYIESDLPPHQQVEQAMDCLPSFSEDTSNHQKFSFHRWTILDYSRAYNSGEVTPRLVAERFIDAVRESCNPQLHMSFFINYDTEDILKQATESTLRYERGEPISVLDGVPIAIKDEIDCTPYPTTGGTTWLHKVRDCKNDACCVQRLRSCGAILVGKTNMHELGAGTSGINPHYGATRNPYNTSKVTGGSSSGSAAVVSAGLCPAALGVDGGGSVRMPAALCGVVGFKPTFGRVSHSGVLPLNWTVGMVGILASTVEDAFIVYAAISGETSSHQPTMLLWFNDCSDDIKVCCSQALDKLHEHYGWETVEVTVPEIETMRLAHYLTIGAECTTSLSSLLQNVSIEELGWDTRVAFRVYGSFDSMEYLNAQRIRNRQMQFHKKIFEKADVIVTPTTGATAYSIMNDALKTGELDYINGAAFVRYQIAGNFLGLPAVTVPIGYDKLGLPIGLQFIGRQWSEPTLIHIAHAMQALCISDYKKPEVYYDLLKKN
ncbi:Fatty acid amide hydrolase [Vitis vinifera]|uniref:Fatty acid amide hydrolase n=1 Tax=Vitis vinifera TaxID=29760 RepID=A0A438KJ21_VITVI|nr:Fatty acid amide hydrolase [Vitis vinifera]